MQRYCCICIMCTNILQTYIFSYDNLSTCKYVLFEKLKIDSSKYLQTISHSIPKRRSQIDNTHR